MGRRYEVAYWQATKNDEYMKKYLKELLFFVNNRFYCGLTILTAVIAYGYAAANISIGIDDVRGKLEIGDGRQVIASGRFSQVILPNLLGYHTEWIENSYAIDVLAVFLLMLSAVNCCILFRKKSKENISMTALAVFSSLMLTYPLINEIWEYTHINLCICTGIFLLTIVIYIVDEWMKTKWNIWKAITIVLLMTFICASYESVVCVYIFLVFSIIFLAILFDQDNWTMKLLVRTGVVYVITLLSGLLGRFVIHKIILTLFHITYDTNGAVGISWRINELGRQLYALIVSWVDMYLLKSIIYFPLTEILMFGILYICLFVYFLRRSRKYIIAVPGIGILLSLVILSLLQGNVTYYRSCQVFSFFVAFVGMLLCHVVQKYDKSARIFITVTFALCLLCIVQSVNLNYWLTLNHLRSEEEQRVIYDIGNDLTKKYDMSKPVVFVGSYWLSDEITELASIPKEDIRWKIYSYIYSKLHGEDYSSIYDNSSRKLVQTNVRSVISWALGDQKDMQKLFAKQGFSIVVTEDSEIWNEAFEKVYLGKVPAYPKSGYIEEYEKYIAVYIGGIK